MELNQRIKVLEDEFDPMKKEIKLLCLDIRTFIMENSSPLRKQPKTNADTSNQVKK